MRTISLANRFQGSPTFPVRLRHAGNSRKTIKFHTGRLSIVNAKRVIAATVITAVAATGAAGLGAANASATSLPQQRTAAHHSVATATVVNDGVQPQFWHAVAQSVVAATAVKVTEAAVKVSTKLRSSSSSESSSSSSGGPAVSANGLHGVIPGDVQYDAN